MSTDHAHVHETKRDAVFRLLSDGRWHAHYEIASVGGVRYSARILELKRMGYTIEAQDGQIEQGRVYRMPSLAIGPVQTKRVKVYLEERDVCRMLDGGIIPATAKAALASAHASFDTNREKL
jgi:hypothetical protein